MPHNHPLNETHLQTINNALDHVKYAKEQIALAKSAGIDVTAHEKILDDTHDKLRKLKNVYFPNQM